MKEPFQFQCQRTGAVGAYKRMSRQQADRLNLALMGAQSSYLWQFRPETPLEPRVDAGASS